MGGGRKLEEGSFDELVALKFAYWTMLRQHDDPDEDDPPSPFPPLADETRRSSSSNTDYFPQDISHNLPSPSGTRYTPPSIVSHPITHDLARSSSRPMAREGFSLGLQQAEEAQASLHEADANSSTSRLNRFMWYLREQRKFFVCGLACSFFV